MQTLGPRKKDYVRYATAGGLRLWDATHSVRWHNLPPDEAADWAEFFDLCRDEPTYHTERVIDAIRDGLCPQRGTASVGQEVRYWHGRWPTEVPRQESFWYFTAGKDFKAPGTFAELSAPFPVTSYLGPAGGRPMAIEAADAFTPWARAVRRRGAFARIWKFKHLPHAWGFLLGRL